MTNDKKKELFPFFAFLFSKEMNPEKYGRIKDLKEWTAAIKDSPEDIDVIAQKASTLSDEDWEGIDQQYAETQQNTPDPVSDLQYAKKGAKLLQLQNFKKGKKIVKKCGCGCDMIDVKEDGGKIASHCSCKCGGKVKKESKVDSKKLDYLKKIKK